jgi:DNA-binding transcriptional LysR family regulator
VINAVEAAHRAVRELSDGVTGEIRIGTTNSIGTYFLPQVLWELHAKCPMVRPQLVYRNSDELIDALLDSKLDVAVAADPRQDQRLRYQVLMEDRISLVCAPGHPFFGRAKVDPAELKGVQVVALTPKTPTGALIQGYLDRLHVVVDPVVSSDNLETVKRMVEVGMGVALLPDMATVEDTANADQPGRLWRSGIEPPLTRHIVLATWRDAPRARAVDLFVDEVRRLGRQGASAPSCQAASTHIEVAARGRDA